MREAVIVSTARTPIGRAYRGAYNDTQGQELAGHVVAEAVRRAGIDPAEVEDVVLGAALQQGSTSFNVARQAAVRAGLPVSVAAMTVDRQVRHLLISTATAARGRMPQFEAVKKSNQGDFLIKMRRCRILVRTPTDVLLRSTMPKHKKRCVDLHLKSVRKP